MHSRKWPRQSIRATSPGLESARNGSGSASKRLLSLDVLRGVTIAFMIMVNNNGGPGAWTQMNHAAWNGFTATDLVFPTFLFVVGVSIVFAIEARLARGAHAQKLAWHTSFARVHPDSAGHRGQQLS